jgi:mRNA-capping enzyme
MLIEEKDKVYMLDRGGCLFSVGHIQFPCDAECTSHLKDTLVDGEFIIDNVHGLFKPSFWIHDIITYNGQDVSTKSLPDRLRLISQSIVNIRDNAIRKGHIKKTTQPFLIRKKDFFGLPEANKLFRPKFLATIPHKVDGLFFLPEKDPYTPGECLRVLKWKGIETIEFRLKIIQNSSNRGALPEKNAHLFLNHMDTPFATMPYSPNLEQYDNEIISCSYKDSEWHFHRIRKDKPFPNSYKTAMGVMDAVQRPITKGVLYNLIKNQSKKRVHGDDSSSTT